MRRPASRAALKSGNLAEKVAESQINAPTHSLLERRAGAVAGFGLVAGPRAVLALDRPAQNAQHRGGDGVTHPAAVFSAADVQAVMRAIFDAPILAGQFQQAFGAGFFRRQTGDHPNRFDFLPAVLEFADAVQAGQLQDVGEAHLFGRDREDFDAAPLEAAVALLNLQELRGKNLPAGSVALA